MCNTGVAMNGGCYLNDHSGDWITVACVSGMLLTNRATCVTECDVGFYLFGDVCVPCPSNCNDCYGPNDFQCSVCDARYSLNYQQICSYKCQASAGFYARPETGATCNSCHSSCKTCFSGEDVSCQSCTASAGGFTYKLKPFTYATGVTDTGYCIRNPNIDYSNFYREFPRDNLIRECPVGCRTCTGQFNCVTCSTGYALYPPLTSGAPYALCYSTSA